MSKPIAYKIDNTARDINNLPKAGGYAVLYKCPQCNEPLCVFLGEKEQFCHNCGESLFWGVIKYINTTLSDKLDMADNPPKYFHRDVGIYEQGLIDMINEMNDKNDFSDPQYLEELDDETT